MKNIEISFLLSILLIQTIAGSRNEEESILEDGRLSFNRLAHKYGYTSESHSVKTKDGYILTVYRMPYKKECEGKKPPVLIMHGLFCSSIDWIITGPQTALGYLLADNCYDVWFGNSRGNTESKRHVALNPKDSRFWNFSWDEMGVHDLPALVRYITSKTGSPDLHYVGHSQGTTQFFVFASVHPELSGRIRTMQAMAPVAFMGNLKRPVIQALSHFYGPLENLSKMVGLYEFMPRNEFLTKIGSEACKDEHPKLQSICTNVLFLICGHDSDQLNETMIPAILGHTPAGASTRQLIHYAQGIKSGRFRKYDHGALQNYYSHYNSIYPPDYEIDNITVPIFIYYSDNDGLVDIRDVTRLQERISSVVHTHRIPYRNFNHLDFMYAKNARQLVYNKILEVLDRN